MERMSRPSASPARIGPQPASNAYNVQYRSSASRRIISIWSLLVDEAPTHQARSNGLEIMSAYRAERRLFTPWRGRIAGDADGLAPIGPSMGVLSEGTMRRPEVW